MTGPVPELQPDEEAVWWVLGSFPVVIQNGLSDGSREPLAKELVDALRTRGWELKQTREQFSLREWAKREVGHD